MSRNLDDIVADIEKVANRIEQLDKRVDDIEDIANKAVSKAADLEKELSGGRRKRRCVFRRKS